MNQEVTAIGGHYILVKVGRVAFQGREVLYLLGHAAFDTTCCGVSGCAYALVPGFILDWKSRTNEEGLAVSNIEPIQDEATRKVVRQWLERREKVHQVRFL